MSDFITVKATSTDNKVVLFEAHENHPQGEAFVYGNGKPVKVARTPLVDQKLGDRQLVEVEAGSEPEPEKAPVRPELQAALDEVARLKTALEAAQKDAQLPSDGQPRGRKSNG